jgi:hypothetical protein
MEEGFESDSSSICSEKIYRGCESNNESLSQGINPTIGAYNTSVDNHISNNGRDSILVSFT